MTRSTRLDQVSRGDPEGQYYQCTRQVSLCVLFRVSKKNPYKDNLQKQRKFRLRLNCFFLFTHCCVFTKRPHENLGSTTRFSCGRLAKTHQCENLNYRWIKGVFKKKRSRQILSFFLNNIFFVNYKVPVIIKGVFFFWKKRELES